MHKAVPLHRGRIPQIYPINKNSSVHKDFL
jgi:hypothetical protein